MVIRFSRSLSEVRVLFPTLLPRAHYRLFTKPTKPHWKTARSARIRCFRRPARTGDRCNRATPKAVQAGRGASIVATRPLRNYSERAGYDSNPDSRGGNRHDLRCLQSLDAGLGASDRGAYKSNSGHWLAVPSKP